MKKRIVFGILSGIIFMFYFNIYRYLWYALIPRNTVTEWIALLVILLVLIPLTVISTQKIIDIIRR